MKVFFILLTALATVFSAEAGAAVKKQTLRNSVEVSAVEKEDRIEVRLKIEPQNGWQIYSHQPGDVGLPTDVKWNLYDHRLVSEQWSEGEDVIYEGFGLNVYRKPAWYTAMLGKAAGEMPDLEISWMACKGECVPESLIFKLTPEVFAHLMPSQGDEIRAAPVSEAFYRSQLLPASQPKTPPAATEKGWLSILLLAFGGGIVLNFMPCVFPILFIKIMSIAGRKSKRRNVTEAFQYLGGVLSCFLLMAALLAWLRHRGADIGWGFQLQSPYWRLCFCCWH